MKYEDGDLDVLIDDVSMCEGRVLKVDRNGKFLYDEETNTYRFQFGLKFRDRTEMVVLSPSTIKGITFCNTEIFFQFYPVTFHRFVDYLEKSDQVKFDNKRDRADFKFGHLIPPKKNFLIVSLELIPTKSNLESGSIDYFNRNHLGQVQVRLQKMTGEKTLPKLELGRKAEIKRFFLKYYGTEKYEQSFTVMDEDTFHKMLVKVGGKTKYKSSRNNGIKYAPQNKLTTQKETEPVASAYIHSIQPILTAVNGNKQSQPSQDVFSIDDDESEEIIEDIPDVKPEPVTPGAINGGQLQQSLLQQRPMEVADENTILCSYPEVGPNPIPIDCRDMTRLPYGEMLNDKLIELGLRYTMENNPKFKSTSYCFNTYFFTNLTANYSNIHSHIGRRALIKTNYAKVKRWTRKVDLFSMEHIVVPVNDDLHWCIFVIKNPGRLLANQMEDLKLTDEKREREPCLYFMMDSIPDTDDDGISTRNNAMEIIRDYLELEFLDKKKPKNPNLFFDSNNMKKIKHLYNPVQTNFIDCGIYALAFFQTFVTKIPEPEAVGSNQYVLNWIKYAPYFELVNVKYYREKLINLIRKQTRPERWSLLEQFERRKYGVINWSPEHRRQMTRKRRCHSFCQADAHHQYRELEKRKNNEKRSHSVPPRLDVLISMKPIVITRSENGPARPKY